MDIAKVTKRYVKQAARSAGIDIRRYRSESTEASRLAATLTHFGIETLVDIGANTGQYGQLVRGEGYAGRIISFEPLPDAHEQLVRNAVGDSGWTIHERCAIGSSPGTISINVAGNSQSSSILPMLAAHSDAAPDSKYIRTEQCKLFRLDDVVPQYVSDYRTTFLKVDTQGFEWEVLQGASATLAKVRAVQLELSLVPLYEGQPLWDFLIEKLRGYGFSVWGFSPVFFDDRTGQTLQVDATFYRP